MKPTSLPEHVRLQSANYFRSVSFDTRLHPQGRWPEVPILIGTANTALLPLKVPNSGSNTGSDDYPKNRFRDVGVTKSVQMSIPLSYLTDTHIQTDITHMTHNDFWDLYTIGPSGKYFLFGARKGALVSRPVCGICQNMQAVTVVVRAWPR